MSAEAASCSSCRGASYRKAPVGRAAKTSISCALTAVGAVRPPSGRFTPNAAQSRLPSNGSGRHEGPTVYGIRPEHLRLDPDAPTFDKATFGDPADWKLVVIRPRIDKKFHELRLVYQAATREAAEVQLRQLHEKWGDKYAIAIRSWQNNWDDLATFFAYPAEIRRLIYTTNPIEAYNRQLRKATKTKGAFPTAEAVCKSFWLAHQNIAANWERPIHNWELILNQLAIRFEGRLPI